MTTMVVVAVMGVMVMLRRTVAVAVTTLMATIAAGSNACTKVRRAYIAGDEGRQEAVREGVSNVS